MLDNTANQPSKFRTENWVEISYDSRGTYKTVNQIKVKTTMIKSSLCDYDDAHILVKGNITIVGKGADTAVTEGEKGDKKIIFKTSTTLTDCINEINNTQLDNAKDVDFVMPMYHLIEYSDNHSKTSGRLW